MVHFVSHSIKYCTRILFLCILGCGTIGISFANPSPNPAIDNNVDIDIVQGNPVPGQASQQNFNELLYETIDPIKDNIETNTPYG